MSVTLTVVCLPADILTADLATAATTRLLSHHRVSAGLTPYFRAGTRLHRRRLLPVVEGHTAGGAVRHLDLDAMRTADAALYWHRWHIWHSVVAGTRAARPFWTFRDRHTAGPGRYPLASAQRDYLAQPRISAMRLYNALPHRLMSLPTGDLEALQTGAHAYAHLGWLAAAVGDAFCDRAGRYLSTGSGPLDRHLSYLHEANSRLQALHGSDHLVALKAC